MSHWPESWFPSGWTERHCHSNSRKAAEGEAGFELVGQATMGIWETSRATVGTLYSLHASST